MTVRYHRPQDDLTQPVDFQAAETFDVFFYRLVETVADAPAAAVDFAGEPVCGEEVKRVGRRSETIRRMCLRACCGAGPTA